MAARHSLLEKADPESDFAAAAPRPATSSARKPWLVSVALGSIVALHLGATFGPSLVGDVFGYYGCHGKHALKEGYLQALIDDGFDVQQLYTQDPPLMANHPAIAYSERQLTAGFPIAPKVAEGIFLQVPNEESCQAASRRYTGTEHMAGSGFDQISAFRLKEEYERLLGIPVTGPFENLFEAGSSESQAMVHDTQARPQVWIDTYFPVLNKPVDREISILRAGSSDAAWSAKLREDIVEGDEFSKLRDEVPVFHGLSKSGNVTAQVVYAGYGRKSDFDALKKAGIEVSGNIALVKYGGVFRGLKVKAAEEAGAVACLIYSDPGDDGPMTEANGHLPYPDGPARNPSSVQRGSVMYLSVYPGDPTTPGEPSYRNATRLEGSGNVPGIPSLPVSYEDAIPLLRLLEKRGKKATELGEDWQGGLQHLDYYTGPSEAQVRVRNEVATRVMPIWNVMAKIPGYLAEEAVMIGNHRDAWVLGASDPSSGTAVVHEIVRGQGALLAKGWKPLRTVFIASWDGEEHGLIGSTEWVEDFAKTIAERVVAYLNIDSAGAGTTYGASASPSLAGLMKAASQEIQHPNDPSRSAFTPAATSDSVADLDSSTGILALGSGSDYSALLQHVGIASSDGPAFSPSPEDAVYHYHSIYDNEYWMEKYGDPGFGRHVVSAKVLGLVLLRMADSLIIPLNVTQYATELTDYKNKVARIHSSFEFEDSLDLSNLTHEIGRLQRATAALDVQKEAALKRLFELTHPRKGQGKLPFPMPGKWAKIRVVLEEIKSINHKVQQFEQGFIGEGLKDREWYKHVGTAPGKWLGYGATTFPSITEALTLDRDVAAAQVEADKVALLLKAMAKRLET